MNEKLMVKSLKELALLLETENFDQIEEHETNVSNTSDPYFYFEYIEEILSLWECVPNSLKEKIKKSID